MVNSLSLSGWLQSKKSLSEIMPDGDVTYLDYAAYPDEDAFFTAIEQDPVTVDIVAGWSLGGQLALRAIEKGYIRTKLLCLIATPFQFVQSEAVSCAMPTHEIETFQKAFLEHPDRMAHQFARLMGKKEVVEQLSLDTRYTVWQQWLNTLIGFSCASLSFADMPKVIVIHGTKDQVVDYKQASLLTDMCKGATLVPMEHCGHAPHIEDPDRIRICIKEAYNAL